MEQSQALLKKPNRKAAGRPPTPAPDLEALDSESSEPIERQVYMSLRRSMMSGAILPGARISSRSIASSLGVSPMPVREALKRLESDGAVAGFAKSAFVVNYPSAAQFAEILKVRLQLECMLAREAVSKITKEDIDRASWLQSRMCQSDNYLQILNYNYKMHFLIYRAAEMPFALSLVENIWVKIGPTLHAVYADRTAPATLLPYHDMVINGLKNKDCDMVERGIQSDLEEAALVILRLLA
jgi:GntR family transcriptional regulator, colanic acid and biofilm gene transcriptional regulator